MVHPLTRFTLFTSGMEPLAVGSSNGTTAVRLIGQNDE